MENNNNKDSRYYALLAALAIAGVVTWIVASGVKEYALALGGITLVIGVMELGVKDYQGEKYIPLFIWYLIIYAVVFTLLGKIV